MGLCRTALQTAWVTANSSDLLPQPSYKATVDITASGVEQNASWNSWLSTTNESAQPHSALAADFENGMADVRVWDSSRQWAGSVSEPLAEPPEAEQFCLSYINVASNLALIVNITHFGQDVNQASGQRRAIRPH